MSCWEGESRILEIVSSMNSQKFLDQIDRAIHFGSEGGHGHLPGVLSLDGKPEANPCFDETVRCNVKTADPLNIGPMDLNGSLPARCLTQRHEVRVYRTTCRFDNQINRSLGRIVQALRVRISGKPLRTVRVKTEFSGGRPDFARMKPSGFENQVCSALIDFRVHAAHNTCYH